MCMERRRFSQTMASEWQTAFVVAHKMPWRALLTAVKNDNKFWKTARLFLQDRDQDQDFMIQDRDQDQDFHFCPPGASRPRPWSRGLHHCFAVAVRLSRWCIVPGSPIILVFWPQRYLPIPRQTPSAGAQNTRGWENFAIFDWNRRLSQKRYEIGPRLLWNVNRKSYMLYRMVAFSMTLTNT